MAPPDSATRTPGRSSAPDALAAPRAFVAPPTHGASVALGGDVYRVVARSEDTGGTLMLIDARVFPGGGPPMHVHSREDESFFVLEGEVTFFTADGPVRAGPGTFLHLPKGVPHAFRNETATPARMLFWCTPAGFERMLDAVGAAPWPDATVAPPMPTDAQKALIAAECPKFGITFVKPG
jgi:mannose-6-phosphate isomerase-like protein (cupin superfamily)